MSLIVHPDPQQPAGGFAFLELPGGSLPDGTVRVAVREVLEDRWLGPSEPEDAPVEVGNASWQPDRYEFGPYEVHRHDGADWVRIGPEIVNKLEEYTPVKFDVAGMTHDVTWPDDVPPRAVTATRGAIQTIVKPVPARRDDDAAFLDKLRTRAEPPPPPPTAETGEDETTLVPEPSTDATNGRLPYLLFLFVALLVGAGLWYVFFRDKTDPNGGVVTGKDTVTIADQEACGFDRLRAIPGGFAAIADAIRGCGAAVSADTALRLVEDSAEKDDPDALLLFGTIYDVDELDPKIENLIGLTFEDDPARATEYYGRAAAAGSQAAADRLERSCARLSVLETTLAKGAYDDFCR